MSDVVQRREIDAQASAVASLRDQLIALGQNEPEYLDISIESETGFREVIEELLDQEAEAEADIAKIKARKDDLTVRQERYAKRKETLRGLIAYALDAANLKKQETAFGTVSFSAVAPKLVITDETEIPTRFWKPADPALDRKALAEALRDREKARSAAASIVDPAERDSALATADAAHPPVPGASLSNGGQTISIRRK